MNSGDHAMKTPLLLLGLLLLTTQAGAATLKGTFATRHVSDFYLEFTFIESATTPRLELLIDAGGEEVVLSFEGRMERDTFYSSNPEGVWFNRHSPTSNLASLNIFAPEVLAYFQDFAAQVDSLPMPDELVIGFPLNRERQEYRGELTEKISARRDHILDFSVEFVAAGPGAPRKLEWVSITNRSCKVY